MIVNLTQHAPTPEQREAGVGFPIEKVKELLTFATLPTKGEIEARVSSIVEEAKKAHPDYGRPYFSPKCVIGGAPYLMGPLEKALVKWGFRPIYAFSQRECIETNLPNGDVKKERSIDDMQTSTATATTPPTLKKVPWLAEILDVSLPRVYAMISDGVIPDRCVLRIGRSIRLQEDETISWLRGRHA